VKDKVNEEEREVGVEWERGPGTLDKEGELCG